MNQMLEQRIANFMGGTVAPTKGAISREEQDIRLANNLQKYNDFVAEAQAITGLGDYAGNAISTKEMQLLDQAQMESGETFTPEEKEMALKKIRELSEKSKAPLFELSERIRMEGEGDDTEIAHVKPGEVIIDPKMIEDDPQFESYLESKFQQYGVPIEEATVGGLPSLNAVTGQPQFGFLKKVGKFLKKVVTPIAKVAQFVPGPWQAPAALISKASTVRDVARGDANPLALLTVAGPTAVGGSISENLAGIKAAGDGSFLKGLGSLGGKTVSSIGQAVMNPMEAIRGIPSLLGSATMSGQPRAQGQIDTDRYELRDLGDKEMYFDKQTGKYLDEGFMPPTTTTSKGGFGGIFSGGGADNKGNYGVLGDVLGGITDRMGITNYGTVQQGQQGTGSTGTGGGIGGLGDLAKIGVTGGLAGALAKLAYEETKKDKGVALTPLTQMDATGRYNIEAEIARRTGQPAPNPVEFGLLPAGTFPTLSGGQPMQANEGGVAQKQYPNKGLEALSKVAPDVVKRMGYYGGGMVMPMAYAEGGNVDMNEFERMNGRIDGQGTETSDDIPAMLSDGEFVMTGQAVRGAGSFEMQEGAGGIISLVPSLDENRERGIDLMYKMMDAFAGKAQPSQEPA